MNRESLPLIVGILIPVLLLLVILLYYYGIDLTEILLKIDVMYYLIILPFVLGFLVIIVKFARPT